MADADALLEQSRFADSVKLQQQQQLQQLFRDNLRLARENAAKKVTVRTPFPRPRLLPALARPRPLPTVP